ncbi:hypothetical protein EST38_g3322 [Candolleomyces aberdarensis]|uniref:Uncharacterized protein n=1 Tax=Candolleomyces aberdarensis TaxID=2316362 RepID=A0A4Q2DQV0_9AGAR|nr:hypothetical protein EST38_g3322 [Candolleomyces aberdarensis]
MQYRHAWIPGYLKDPEPLSHLLLATVKWDRTSWSPPAVFEQREHQLKTNAWSNQIKRGVQVERFLGTTDSAWTILSQLLDLIPLELSMLQRDLLRIFRLASGREEPLLKVKESKSSGSSPFYQKLLRTQQMFSFNDINRGLKKRETPQGVVLHSPAGTTFSDSRSTGPLRFPKTHIQIHPNTASFTTFETASILSTTDTAFFTALETASILSTTDTAFFTAFDTESILSNTDTGFFTAIEPVDPEDHDPLRSSSTKDEVTGTVDSAVETVTFSISQEPNDPVVASSTLSNIPASTTSDSEADESESQAPSSSSVTTPPAPENPSLGDLNIQTDLEGAISLFQSANRWNFRDLNITVNINPDVRNRQ